MILKFIENHPNALEEDYADGAWEDISKALNKEGSSIRNPNEWKEVRKQQKIKK